MSVRVPLGLLCAVLAGACAEPSSTLSPSASPTRDTGQVYEVGAATVLSSPDHGPQLCAGPMRTSLPPQCGGPPVTPWDWSAVDGEESVNGTSWGGFHLVGTFDGTTFHLTQPPAPPRQSSAPPRKRFDVPCAELAPGGDPAKAGDDARRAATAHAREQDDFAGAWLANAEAVLVLGFTGDLARHEREARERWGGGLCVTELPRTHASLERAQTTLTDAHREAEAAGVFLLSSDIDVRAGVVVVDVLVADGTAQAWVDAKIGAGLARLVGFLRPTGTPTG